MTVIPEKEVDSKAFRNVAKKCYDDMESYIGGDWVKRLENLVGIS